MDLVANFATTPERKSLLRRLFQYRARLRELGFSVGFQWIDGSFVENVENLRGRPPGDIDVVTLAPRPEPHSDDGAWAAFVADKGALLDSHDLSMDSYFVDMSLPANVVIRQSVFWFGLFSHQRETALWKGLVQMELGVDDAAAIALLGDDHG